MTSGLEDGFFNTCARWAVVGKQCRDIAGDIGSRDRDDRMVLAIGISIGLGTLFNENRQAECDWMRKRHAGLNGETPLDHITNSDVQALKDVAELVDEARGL